MRRDRDDLFTHPIQSTFALAEDSPEDGKATKESVYSFVSVHSFRIRNYDGVEDHEV